ncbi:MAG: DUF421 domain-containing protein [Rubricoccaceae bacterium]
MNTFSEWIGTTAAATGLVALSAVGVYAAVIALTRLAGLRSFAKMSSFDFAMTVAIGSIVATVTLTRDVSLLRGVAGLAAIYALQIAVGALRTRSRRVERWVGNEPLLLMAGPEVLRDNLRRAHVTEADLRAKLRQAGVARLADVRAVVFETTGDVAVLTGEEPLDPALFAGVRDAARLFGTETEEGQGQTRRGGAGAPGSHPGQ